MKNVLKMLGVIVGVLILVIGVSFAMGWSDVFYTSTVGKAKQNAQREVFEETQSYVEGKRQEAVKLYKEYQRAETIEDKKAIQSIVSLSFANFDEEKLAEPLRTFVYQSKYN